MVRFFQKYEVICASSEPYLIYDVSGVRTNVPNPQKQYEIEDRFLREFNNLIPESAYPLFWKKLWMSTMSNSLIASDIATYKKSKKMLQKHSTLCFKDRMRLIKSWCIGCVTNY